MTPRPNDREDEDWEDDFDDFQQKATSTEVISDGDNGAFIEDFGSFTQVSVVEEGAGERGHDDRVNVTEMVTGTEPDHRPPMVETVGDYTEFSNSEAAEDFVTFQNTESSATAQSLDAGTSDVVVSDGTTSRAEQSSAVESVVEDHSDEVKKYPFDALVKDDNIVPHVEIEDTDGNFDSFGTPTNTVDESITTGPGSVEEEETPAAGTGDKPQSFADDGTMDMDNRDAPPVVESVDSSEGFGDFDTAPVTTTDSEAIPQVETVDNSDSFGDFGSAEWADTPSLIVGTINTVTTTATTNTIPEVEDGASDAIDFFGGSGRTVSQESSPVSNATGDGVGVDPFESVKYVGSAEPSAAGLTVNEVENGEFPTTSQTNSAPETTPVEDSFGELGAISTISPGQNVVSNPDENDEFGDFGAANSEPNVESDGKSAGNVYPETDSRNAITQSVNEGDDYAEGGSATSASVAIFSNDDDDLGDFGHADPALETQTPALVDSFGDFEASAKAETTDAPVAAAAAAAADDDDDYDDDDDDDGDDFGEFGSAERAEIANTEDGKDIGDSGNTEVPEKSSADVHDDFSDFGAASAPEKSSADVQDDFDDFGAASAPEKSSADVQDDFGDFGAASAPEKSTADVEDDFGDFGAASAPEKSSADVHDDFGDFGAASAPEKSSANVQDDFGDFGAVSAPEKSTADVEDDFGDFGAVSAPESANDIDDFGDFGAASAPEKSNDDDEFGEFDAAESTPVDITASEPKQANSGTNDDDDFGGFNDVSDGGTRVSEASRGYSDPLLQPVASAMHRMFQKPSIQVPDDSDGESSVASVAKLSIEKLMVSPNWRFLQYCCSYYLTFHLYRNLYRKLDQNQRSLMNCRLSGIC